MAEIFTEHPHDLAAVGTGQVIAGDTADEEFGEPARLEFLQPGAHFVVQAEADEVGRQLAIQNPAFRLGVVEDVGEQVVHFQHFDAALAHLGDEIEVVALGLADP